MSAPGSWTGGKSTCKGPVVGRSPEGTGMLGLQDESGLALSPEFDQVMGHKEGDVAAGDTKKGPLVTAALSPRSHQDNWPRSVCLFPQQRGVLTALWLQTPSATWDPGGCVTSGKGCLAFYGFVKK